MQKKSQTSLGSLFFKMNHKGNVSHFDPNLKCQDSNLCGAILQLPTEFYAEKFVEDKAKEVNSTTRYRVVLQKYLKETKNALQRYTFIDTDDVLIHRFLPAARS